MAPLVSILVPFAPAGPERDAAWLWNRTRLRRLLPDAEICVGAPDIVGEPGIFSRSLALNRAAELARGDILVICDADTTYPEVEDFRDALELVAEGFWTLPHRYVRLGPRCSSAWTLSGFTGPPPSNWEHDIEEELLTANSGVVVMLREAFDKVGGFDERFKGWGGEDDAMRGALEALWGPPSRHGIAMHLWHPRPPEDSTGGPYHAESMVLAARYTAASADPEAMKSLLAESR